MLNPDEETWNKLGFKLMAIFWKDPIMLIMLIVLNNQGYSNVCLLHSIRFDPRFPNT